ncbi:MAG TPA: sodium:proton antiporter, partial [Lachnospiraceae bacterium]|nr:sodium:proton antiporter [Lachnospiraceae bacterium]
MAAGIIAYCIGRKNKTARDLFADAITVLETGLLLYLSLKTLNGAPVSFAARDLCGLGLTLKLDGFRVIYGLVAALMWTCTTVFSREYMAHYPRTNRYYMFFLATMGATVGVFLSADLFTTFLFFEIMSFTSYTWVAHDETKESLRAAETYLAVAVIGGMVLLLGLFFLYSIAGTLSIDEIYGAVNAAVTKAPSVRGRIYTAGALMLTGFAAKAGMFPLHIWLPKAHPVAPAPASALLSGILTKSGIFGVLIISTDIFRYDPAWGFMILLFGVITMFGGAMLGIFSINLKRTLACSSMSQIGFILAGIGMQGLLGHENGLAVRGTILHMVNHSLIKLVLFMCAGVIYMNLHELDINKIRGYGRGKYFLMICFLAGGLSISGIPGFSGYLSKTLLHESIVEYMEEAGAMYGTYKFIECVFLMTGGMTLAYMLKLFIAVFIEKGAGMGGHPGSHEDVNMVDSIDDENDKYKGYLNAASSAAIL